MPLRREDKKSIVEELGKVANSHISAVVGNSSELTADQMTSLRKKARKDDVFVQVVRNTLAEIAFEKTEFKCLKEVLVGPTVIAFSKDDPGAAARLFKDFAKEHKSLKVKGLSIDGKLLAPEQLDSLANIPTKDKAIAILMSTLLAPISKLARTMNAVPEKMVRTLSAVADDKQKAE